MGLVSSRSPSIPWKRFHDEISTIVVRSDRDRGVLPRAVYAVGLESDAPKNFTKRGGSRFIVAVGSESDAQGSSRRAQDCASRGRQIGEV